MTRPKTSGRFERSERGADDSKAAERRRSFVSSSSGERSERTNAASDGRAEAGAESTACVGTRPSLTERIRRRAEDALLDYTVFLGFGQPGYGLRKRRWEPQEMAVDMAGRVCVVTGANAGIGKAVATGLAQRGATVVMGCRNLERGNAARESVAEAGGNVVVEVLDVSSLASVRAFTARVSERFGAIDVLVNNAGAMFKTASESVDGIELSFATNVVGGWLLTRELTPALARSVVGGRVIHVSSGGMYLQKLEVGDPQWRARKYDDVKAYAEAKRAQVVLSERWAREFAAHGHSIVSNAMHPGWVATPGVASALPKFETIMRPLLRSPDAGADTIVWLAVADRAGRMTGKFFFDRQARRTHVRGRTKASPEERGLIWEICARLAGDAITATPQ
ncbi:MAG: dehydrogenase/reductase SDR family protein 12 [Myxococcota bacterium]|jgi:dehydrogenase/reductase SDR family protein 12